MRLRAPAIANAAADADADANAADSLSSSLFFQTPPLKTTRIFDEERKDKRGCYYGVLGLLSVSATPLAGGGDGAEQGARLRSAGREGAEPAKL